MMSTSEYILSLCRIRNHLSVGHSLKMSNTFHYRKGSTKPALPDDGVYRLYSMRFCPYAARTHLVLDAKNIPYHTINVHVVDKPEWLFDANPLGKVPALQLVDKPGAPFIYESILLAEYLDEVHPENKLFPSDPLKKVQEKLLIERFEKLASKFYITTGDRAEIWNDIQKDFDEFERELGARGTIYFGGSKPNVLDYAMWPWFVRTEVSEQLFAPGCTFSEKRFPHLVKWYKSLNENDKAVQKYAFSKEDYLAYSETRNAGNPDFDFLAKKSQK